MDIKQVIDIPQAWLRITTRAVELSNSEKDEIEIAKTSHKNYGFRYLELKSGRTRWAAALSAAMKKGNLPSVADLAMIADLLGITIDWILFGGSMEAQFVFLSMHAMPTEEQIGLAHIVARQMGKTIPKPFHSPLYN